jgi:hypothetical protein
MSDVSSVAAPANTAPSTDPNSVDPNSDAYKAFVAALIQNSVLGAMGDFQSMEDKLHNAMQEQHENDTGY